MSSSLDPQILFDKAPDRSRTNSFKWDGNLKKFGRADVIPLWIADMDFALAPVIQSALQARLDHPVFGYNFRREEYYLAIQKWLSDRFDWHIVKKNMLFYPPGTVAAVDNLVCLFSEPGDQVIVFTPSYPPLMNIVKQNKRALVESPLKLVDDEYQIDEKQFESCFSDKTKLLILCSPHNPTGRVWREQELTYIAKLCKSNGVTVISDEVHSDLVEPQASHIHFNRLPQNVRPPSVTIISSCKTFNLAAMSQSTLLCDDARLKRKIQWAINKAQINLDNSFSAAATEAAYAKGAPWLDLLREYISESRQQLGLFVNDNLKGVKLIKAQGTYLAWLDFSGLAISHQELAKLLVDKAGVGLYDGLLFGSTGEGFFRINMACPRTILLQAMQQIAQALKKSDLITPND